MEKVMNFPRIFQKKKLKIYFSLVEYEGRIDSETIATINNNCHLLTHVKFSFNNDITDDLISQFFENCKHIESIDFNDGTFTDKVLFIFSRQKISGNSFSM